LCGTSCAGTWSGTCTNECVLSTWTETVAKSGNGVPCPAATLCSMGDGECQMAATGAQDTRVLREAKAAADTSACTCNEYLCGSGWRDQPCPLDSWTADTEPCGDGYDDLNSGWVGVLCDARGGRVVRVNLWDTGVGGELLPFFGRLGALLALYLADNPLRGDVADLAGATELRDLQLQRCPLVVGEAASLAALVHLGEEYTTPVICSGWSTRSFCRGGLYLAGSGIHGPVAALRALPGLGSRWGSFSKCSNFDGCGAAGLAPVAVSRMRALTLSPSLAKAENLKLWHRMCRTRQEATSAPAAPTARW